MVIQSWYLHTFSVKMQIQDSIELVVITYVLHVFPKVVVNVLKIVVGCVLKVAVSMLYLVSCRLMLVCW
jgi:hypothetical protein